MNRRVLPLMAAELVFGVCCFVYRQPLFGAVAVVLFFLILFSLRDEKNIHSHTLPVIMAVVLGTSFFAGLIRGGLAIREQEKVREFVREDQTYTVEGKLIQKVNKESGAVYYLDRVRIAEASGKHPKTEVRRLASRVMYYPKKDEAEVGSIILARGRAAPLHSRENEGGFDEEEYLTSCGIFVKLYGERILGEKRPRISLRRFLYRLRCGMLRVYEACLPGEESGVIVSMVLGDKSLLQEDVRKLFSGAGLSHLLAISGLHVSILGMAVLGLLRRLHVPMTPAALLAGGFVALYGILTGESVSTLRAVGMFGILAGANILGEGYDVYSAMGAVMFFMVFWQPFYVKNASFILSFTAVFGTVYLGGGLSGLYEKREEERWRRDRGDSRRQRWVMRPHEKVISGLLSMAGLFLFLLPVTAYYFYSVSLYSVLLNLLVLPFACVLLVAAFAGGLAGLFCLPLGRLILLVCHPILYFYEFCADLSLKLPFARQIIGRPPLGVILFYYGFLFLFFSFMRRGGRFFSKLCLLGMILILVINIRLPRPFEVDVLSVGQGDGIFVDSGFGERIFIDGGSTSSEGVGAYTILPFLQSRGIAKIDVWFITHMDADHCNGFLEVLQERYPVGELVLAESIEKTGEYERMLRLCSENHVPVRYVKTGDVFRFAGGLSDRKEMKIRILFPEGDSTFVGPNENSLAFQLSYGSFDAIFTGDIGADQEEWILDHAKPGGEIELLKSAHHGSKNSNCQRWLEVLSPRLTVFSAGEGNRYGHPSAETLRRCEDLGLDTLCTIDCGQISVRWKDGRMVVERFLQPKLP